MNDNICIKCGLCCDGTFFSFVELDREENELPFSSFVDQETGLNKFSQPCPHFKDCQCSIYEVRPAKCKIFTCNHLDRFLNHEVNFEEAVSVIEEIKEVINQLKERLDQKQDDGTIAFRDQLYNFINDSAKQCDPVAHRRENADIFMLIGKFHMLRTRHFVK